MRSVLILGLLAASVASRASFELVMVADRGTKSVHRFDGNSGVYLGAFGQGYLQNPMSIALDQENNRVFVADQVGTGNGSTAAPVRVWGFNYNTGEYLSNWNTAFSYLQPQIAMLNGSLLVGHDQTFADVYTPSGTDIGSVNWVSVGAVNPKGIASDNVGRVWAFEGNRIYSSTSSGSYSSYAMASSIASSGSSGQRQLAISGTRALAVGALSFSTINLAGLSTTNGANSLATTTVTNYNQVNGAAFGHGDIAYIAGTGSGGTIGQMSRIIYSEGLVTQTFGQGVLVEPRSLAVVNAPEPATLLALGAGALALLRRRKRA